MLRALVLPMVMVATLPGFVLCAGAQVAVSLGQTQTQVSSLPTSSTSGTVEPFELMGHVINARTNAPIARALVKFGQRAVLTNHDGVFLFPQVTSVSGVLVPRKEGFYGSPSGDTVVQTITTFTPESPVDVMLYPEAVISGVVASASGEGLSNFIVTMRRSTFDEYGHHWQATATTHTDSSGAYRQVLAPGDYSVQARTFGRARGDGEMYLPVSVPADSASIADALHVKMGDQAQVNLRPEARKGYVVSIASDADAARGFPRLVAYNANGMAISLAPMPEPGAPGTFRVVLPNGSYRLAATMQSKNATEEGEAQVTVAGRDVGGVVLHYNQTPRLPVEVSVEPGVSTDTVTIPNARTLGLMLAAKVTNGDGVEQTYPVMTGQDKIDGFVVPHGAYQLQMRTLGPWYVTAADYGGSNLLTEDLVAGLGGGGQPIRVRISNQTASVTGTVTVNGLAGPAYVYLVATMPSAHPVMMVRANTDGSFTRSSIQPGAYRVLATELKLALDPRAPATLTRFLGKVQVVTADSATKQTVTLEAVPAKEMPQ